MNKHLVNFFDDELKNNNYYESIRKFAENKNIVFNKVVSSVVNEYDKNGDYFNPYKFCDAIENFIRRDEFKADKYTDFDDIITDMWKQDYFSFF